MIAAALKICTKVALVATASFSSFKKIYILEAY